jgi:hypothetical protein
MSHSTSSNSSGSTGNSEQPACAAAVTAPSAHASGRLLRRAEAARMLGVSKSTLRRMEGTALTPVMGPKNVRLFLEEEVRSVIVTRRAQVEPNGDLGDVAADAFARFDAGSDVIDVVKALRCSPDVAETLYAQWARLRRLLVVSDEARSQISTILLGWDNATLKTEADLLALLKKWVTEESMRRCWQCKNEWACFCRACAKQWGLGAAKQELGEKAARKL